jgi:hypothetical protein
MGGNLRSANLRPASLLSVSLVDWLLHILKLFANRSSIPCLADQRTCDSGSLPEYYQRGFSGPAHAQGEGPNGQELARPRPNRQVSVPPQSVARRLPLRADTTQDRLPRSLLQSVEKMGSLRGLLSRLHVGDLLQEVAFAIAHGTSLELRWAFDQEVDE